MTLNPIFGSIFVIRPSKTATHHFSASRQGGEGGTASLENSKKRKWYLFGVLFALTPIFGSIFVIRPSKGVVTHHILPSEQRGEGGTTLSKIRKNEIGIFVGYFLTLKPIFGSIFVIRPSEGVAHHILASQQVGEGVQPRSKLRKNESGIFFGVLFDAESELWDYFCHPPL